MSETTSFSRIHFFPKIPSQENIKSANREKRILIAKKLKEYLDSDSNLKNRFELVSTFSRKIRVSEYHLTNACNIRCEGCWFFEFGHDTETEEEKNIRNLEAFLDTECKERKINTALVIGGEPTLFPDRLAVYKEKMRYLTISSNGLKKLPKLGFEDVTVALTLFGGGPLDDQLRGIKPSGRRFSGLFDKALDNYKDDPRAIFIYALTEDGIQYIEETVKKIHSNGNILNFNFYSKYGESDPSAMKRRDDLLAEAMRVKHLYPNTVISHPYFIQTMITGVSHWDYFRYENCPSISFDHPAHENRLKNGSPSLPMFNTWSADLKTVKFCCTSGHCNGCRDSQAVFSWLLVSMSEFLDSADQLKIWVEIAESYWSQFYWSPMSKNKSQSVDQLI
jgi:MoaA/NifB/PqqE/SkfB family radical SAM enzyme